MFSAEVLGEGLVMISGMVTEPLPCDHAIVLVSPGTMFTGGSFPVLLKDDGSLERVLNDGANINVDASYRKRLRLTPEGTFVKDAA